MIQIQMLCRASLTLKTSAHENTNDISIISILILQRHYSLQVRRKNLAHQGN